MFVIRVAAASLNTIPLNWSHNFSAILQAIEEARANDVEILCLPELCVTGYSCEDAFSSPELLQKALNKVLELAPHTLGMVVCVGLPVSLNKSILNCACVLADGRIIGIVPKKNLAGDGVHYEPRWFKPSRDGVYTIFRQAGLEIPLGDLVFDFGGVRLGFEICEDAWSIQRPGNLLARRGVDIILNPSASHFSFGKAEVRKRFVMEASRAFGAVYLYSNLNGCESGRVVFDGGALIASEGKVRALGPRFSFDRANLTICSVDLEYNRSLISRVSSLTENLDDKLVIFDSHHFRKDMVESEPPKLTQALEYHEEFSHILALGLRDWLERKGCTSLVLPEGSSNLAHSCMLKLSGLLPHPYTYAGMVDYSQPMAKQTLLCSPINRSEISLGLWDVTREAHCDLAPFGGISETFLCNWTGIDSEGRSLLGIPLSILGDMERAAVLKRRGPKSIFSELSGRYPQYSEYELFGFVRQFLTSFCQTAGGRERLPPSFHLDEQSLDAHLWFRFPAFNGAFFEELEELKMNLEETCLK